MSKKKKSQEAQEQKQPKRQVKVVYYDDNSTVADMSGTRKGGHQPPRVKSTMREKMRTFFTVMKRMVLPMLVSLAVLTILYIVILAAAGRL